MAEDGEERVGINLTFAKDRRAGRSTTQSKTIHYVLGFVLWCARIMNCLGGVVERDARPPIPCSDSSTKHQIHTLPDSNTVEYLLRLQTRLLYEENKASLYCKTNLFAVQGSLVCVWGVCVLWISGLGVQA